MLELIKNLWKKENYYPHFSEVTFDALLIVDMQPYFIKELRKGEDDKIIRNQQHVISFCNRNSIPIIVVEYRRYGKALSELTKLAGNAIAAIIQKEFDGGFSGGELDSILTNLNIKNIFIVGINACYCILSTTRDALYNGYKVVISEDAISGRCCHPLDNGMPWFRKKCTVVNIVHQK